MLNGEVKNYFFRLFILLFAINFCKNSFIKNFLRIFGAAKNTKSIHPMKDTDSLRKERACHLP